MPRLLTGWFSTLTVVAALVPDGQAPAQEIGEASQVPSDSTIVVTAGRAIIEPLLSVSPEREYDQRDVAAYGASTVGEFVDQVRDENGDDEAIFLVDGEPVTGIDDVADFPAEAVDRLEVLPLGSGLRIGREADRRVYNVVLKKQLRSATLTAGREEATDGKWAQTNGETLLTRIAGRRRFNLSGRASGWDTLTEADRGVRQPDPASLLPSADYLEPVDAGAFRTLRGPSRSYEASFIGGVPLASWLNSSFSLIGRIGRDRSLSGLPYSPFLLPGTSPHSRTGSDELLVLFGSRPLTNRSVRRSLNANLVLNASRASWIAGVTGQFSLGEWQFDNERLDSAGADGPIRVPVGRDPFTEPLDEFFVTRTDIAASYYRSWLLKANVGGSLFELPAGALRVRGTIERNGRRSHSTSDQASIVAERHYRQSATRFDAGLDVPLAGDDFLAPLGRLTLSLDRGYDAVDQFMNLGRSSLTALWQPGPRLTLTAFAGRAEELPPIDLIADPVVVYDDVRTFDFLTGETVDATLITGGNPGLEPLSKRTLRLSFSAAPWPKYNLQLNADYEAIRLHDFISAVPAVSREVFLAFPDRFRRDPGGRLVLVDTRPVNFERESREELRYGLSLTVPLGPGPGAAGERARVQATLSHAILFKDEISFRAGLAPVDMLEAGALGFGGGRSRHRVTASLTYSDAAFGVRLTGVYRSSSHLLTGAGTPSDTLRFAPIFTAALRAHTDLAVLLPQQAWLNGTRVSLGIDNLTGRRQRVSDSAGLTPLRYQPAYRDPVGRTFEIELRKVF